MVSKPALYAFPIELIEAIGLDPNDVASFTLTRSANTELMINVGLYIKDEWADKMVEVVRKYRLTPELIEEHDA